MVKVWLLSLAVVFGCGSCCEWAGGRGRPQPVFRLPVYQLFR